LEIAPDRVAITRREHDAQPGFVVVRGGRRRIADLTQVFPAGGLDQPIRGVVRVVAIRVDALVAEVPRLLRVVADTRDVAHRLVRLLRYVPAGSPGCRRGESSCCPARSIPRGD